MSNKSYIQILRSFGFKKVQWDKCPQGFQKANYPCYSDKKNNRWCEVYLGDQWPYVWIVGNGIKSSGPGGGRFYDEPKELQKLLNSL